MGLGFTYTLRGKGLNERGEEGKGEGYPLFPLW